MSRDDLKEIIARVVAKLEEVAPGTACMLEDCDDCQDIVPYYSVGDEAELPDGDSPS